MAVTNVCDHCLKPESPLYRMRVRLNLLNPDESARKWVVIAVCATCYAELTGKVLQATVTEEVLAHSSTYDPATGRVEAHAVVWVYDSDGRGWVEERSAEFTLDHEAA